MSLNQQDEQTITSGSVYNPRSRDKRGYAAPALGEYNHGFMNSRAAQEAGKALYVDNGKQGGWHETYFTERGADLANAYALLRQNHSSEELRNLSEADMIKKAYEERIRGVVELSETADRELQGIMERLPGLTVDPKNRIIPRRLRLLTTVLITKGVWARSCASSFGRTSRKR